MKDEDLPLYENALCGSAPMFEADDQHDDITLAPMVWAVPFPVWGCHERWTAALWGPMKGVVIRSTSCKKLLTNIRLVKHTSVCVCV